METSKQKQKLWRAKFNRQCLERDDNTCCFCDEDSSLDVHHITDRHEMPNGGYVPENGITLCEFHHLQAEEFHRCGGSNWEKGFHPDDLYEMIGSSKELAIRKSEELR